MARMKHGEWYLTSDANVPAVRRMVLHDDGRRTQERLPIKEFKRYLNDPLELAKFVARINGRDKRAEEAKANAVLAHAFVSPTLIDDFALIISQSVPNQKDARYLIKSLKRYCLTYFIVHLKLIDPVEWKAHEHSWGAALLGESPELVGPDWKPSRKFVKTVTQIANRFLAYLHARYPAEYPPLKFSPISLAKLGNHEATRKMGETPRVKFLDEAAAAKIITEARRLHGPAIAASFALSYSYGLRRGESQAVALGDIRREYLSIGRQFKDSSGKTYPLKNLKDRKTPHWLSSAKEAYALIQDLATAAPVHPDTLGQYFTDACKAAGVAGHEHHDLRRSFITRALRGRDPRDVQLAVGHSSLTTTMGYAQDDRDLADEVYDPAS